MFTDGEVLSGVSYHCDTLGDSQVLHRDNFLDHLIALDCFALDPLTKVRVVSLPLIVSIGIQVIFHIGDSFSVEWACGSVMRVAASQTAHLSHLLHHVNRASYDIYL